jgi:hypothetical protein
MGSVEPDRVCRSKHSREVVGFVDVLQKYRKVELTPKEDLAKAVKPLWSHESYVVRVARWISVGEGQPGSGVMICLRVRPGSTPKEL